MAADSNTSMSALGQFYDAVFSLAENQAKKYGKEAKPDFVAGEFSDGLAGGIASLASSFGINPALGEALQKNVTDNARNYWAGGWNIALNVGDWFPSIISPGARVVGFSEATADEFGNYVGDGPGVKADPNMKIDLNDVLEDPRKIAVSAADKYFDSQRMIMQLKAIAGAGSNMQEAALQRTARTIGVDGDVAATIAQARVGIENNNQAAGNLRDDVVANSLAMYAGVTNEADRAALAGVIKTKVMSEVTRQHNTYASSFPTVGGATSYAYGKPVDGFYDLFGDTDDTARGRSGTNILGEYSKADLFSANPYGATNPTPGRGAVLKQAIQSGIQQVMADPAVAGNARLRTSLMQLYSSFDNEDQVHDLLRALNRSANNKFKDMSHLVKVGAAGLSAEYARQGDTNTALKYAKAGSLAGSLDGTMTWGDSAAYIYNRIKTNGLWGAASNLTGSVLLGNGAAIKSMIDGGSVVTSLLFSGSPRTGTKADVKVAQLMEKRDSGYALAKGPQKEIFARYYWGREEFKRNPDGTKKIDSTTGKYVTEMPKGEKAMRSIDWKPLDWAVDHSAGGLAKGAFMFHTFHPWQMVTGFFDGSTAQRFMWIGSGFGRHLQDPSKWDGLARFGSSLLKNQAYKNMAYTVGYVKQVVNLPSYLIKDAMQVVKKKVVDDFLVGVVMEKVAMKVATKLGLEATLRAIMGFLTEGASEAVIWIYEGVNFVTGGLLDKIVKGFLRLTFEFVMLIVVFVIAVIAMLAITANSFMALSLSSAALYKPDPDYYPRLVSVEPPPGGGGPVYPPGQTINLPGAKGIDVSHYQDNIDWPRVANEGKVEFAIIKATEGTGWIDEKFKQNWSGSRGVGIKRSAYHYFLGQYDGAQQADHFLRIVNNAGGGQDFELAVDVEWYGQTASKEVAARNLKKMLDRMYDATGVYPMIYTSSYAWSDVVGNPGWGGPPYPLWIAGYLSDPKYLVMPKGWSDWEIWQYTDSGQVPGIRGGVDLDLWNDNAE